MMTGGEALTVPPTPIDECKNSYLDKCRTNSTGGEALTVPVSLYRIRSTTSEGSNEP